ncbi:MAG: hypothetical protein ACPLOC_03785 [Candidatus Bathyarchaeales archaeon]
MNQCVFLLKKITGIPENHWLLLFLGEQGVGKSQLASLTVKQLAENEGLPVVVVCDVNKEKTIQQWWSRNVPEHVWWKGITFGQVRRLRNSVLVLEDLPLIMRSKARRLAVESLLSALARENRIFTVVTTQYPHGRLLAGIPLKVELQVRGDRHFYRVREWKNSTAWFDWTANSYAKEEDAKPILDTVYHGVKGKELGRKGKVNPESKRQKAFRLFEIGKTNREIAETLNISHELTRYYRHLWNEQRKLLTNTLTLSGDEENG